MLCYCYAQFSFAQEESNVYASTINPCPQCLEISQVGFSLDRCSSKYKYTYKYNHKYYVIWTKNKFQIYLFFYLFLYVFSLNIYGAEIVIKDIMDHYLVLMWRIFSQWNNHNMTRMKMTRMAKLGFWSASCGTFIPSTAVTHICPPLFNTYLPTLVNTGQTFPAQLHTNTLCKICTCKTSFNQNHSMLLLVSPESPRS